MMAASVAAPAAEFRIGQAAALPGAVVVVPATLSGASGAVGAQFDLSFNPDAVTLTGISADPALTGHLVDQQQLAPGRWRALVYSTTNGPITPGALLWLSFSISANAPVGVLPLVISNTIVAQAAGHRMQPLAQVNGALVVASAENFVSAEPLATGQLGMTILGPSGRVFTLQGTPDFFHWADLATYTNETGTLLVTNRLPAGRNAYFYRTVARPATGSSPYADTSLSGALLLPDGKARLQLNAVAGTIWRLQGSPDLFHWGNYGLVTNATGTLLITNTPVSKPEAYSYRVAQP